MNELLPGVSRVAVLWNPRSVSEATTAGMVRQATEATPSLGLELRYVEVPRIDAFERASPMPQIGTRMPVSVPKPDILRESNAAG
jgi:hypothetical protein